MSSAPQVQLFSTPLPDPATQDQAAFQEAAGRTYLQTNAVFASMNAALAWQAGQTTQVATNAGVASQSAAAAAVSAAAAAATSTAASWVSGTTYAVGNVRRSLIDGLPYLRLTAGAGTTDPRNDPANWELDFLQIETDLPEIRPTLLLDPVNSGSVDSRIVTTRASEATYWDAFGALRTAPANTLRIDHDPLTGERLGYLIESPATNMLLNSLIDGTSLTTQNVTVAATQHCISFYGTGTITLSGAHSATLVGSGVFPARTHLAFTPSAGTLTVTVSGEVNRAQLETGVTSPTSYIPTAGAAATRAADKPVITGAAFSNFFNAEEGTFVATWKSSSSVTGYVFNCARGETSHFIGLLRNFETNLNEFIVRNSTAPSATRPTGVPGAQLIVAACVYKQDIAQTSNSQSGLGGLDTTVILPTLIDNLWIGCRGSIQQLGGHLRSITYYPRAVSAAQLQALSRI
jgi:hypothetical protein